MSEASNHSSSDLDNDIDTRPNRWTGPPASWQALTEAERGLAASLDTLRNAELSIHLFNAYALKRRAREFEGLEGVSKCNADFHGIPEEDQAFKPPKRWTAWPLRPDNVPRAGEDIGPPKPFEEYTFKTEADETPSRELEDVLVGVTLKFAKVRFHSREEGKEEDEEICSDKRHGKGKGKAKMVLSDDMDSTGSEYHSSSNDEPIVKESSKSPQQNPRTKPVVSADDERSRDLLRPSIRHTLSKLDEILIALHHARKPCHRYTNSEAGTTDDESVADTALSKSGSISFPSKRPVGRPRKFADLPNRAKVTTNPEPEQDDLFRAKRTHLGRPIKVYERLEGEAQADYVVRIARLQKKPLPKFAPPPESKVTKLPSPRRGRSRSMSVPARRATSEELKVSRRKKLELRDWSEVLGVAALVGFDADVLERAARRCADLFGEGMVMRRLPEMAFGEREGKDQFVKYKPELIPALDENLLELSPSSAYSRSSSSSSSPEPDIKIKSGIRTTSTPSGQAVFCPIPACPRRVQGFRDMPAMKRHLEKGHGVKREDVDEYILPSDEEMEGAVHVDGYLRVIKRARGLRGKYRGRKRKIVEREEENDDEDEHEENGEEKDCRAQVEVEQGGLSDQESGEDHESESESESESGDAFSS